MKVISELLSHATRDGDGVNISRVADFRGRMFDPFLMIDELKSDEESDFIGGFPPHPHRGIETFTYIIKGGFEHKDQMGNRKVISGGDVQWMSTGFGVIHSEMPVADNEGMHGFQIWVNMAAADKLRPARYQDSVATGLPVLENTSGASLKVLAGNWVLADQSAASPVGPLASDAAVADIRLSAGGTARIERTQYEKLFVYIHTGSINGYSAGQALLLDPQQAIEMHTDVDSGALIFSGTPLREPVAHMGPFVMNTQEELHQAVRDYQAGRFGAIDL
ncbi:pirin family protein [Shewanella corallii]|uniref:Pirin family protein n=1 Tax=Shewanella corallii TaxID=560080 RepID=A0ABT0N3F1_9GAMM|nr:pirin family protein [Shewanella corallii]MCL2912953.1 pirin family protein [Shewanella corallii]